MAGSQGKTRNWPSIKMFFQALPCTYMFCHCVACDAKGKNMIPHPTEGVVRFYVGIRVCDASASTPRPHPVSRQSSSLVDPAEYPARAARQWIPPSLPPELLASGSRTVFRQSCSPVDPALAPSIPPERLASGSRRVSRQSCSPVDPAEYPARAARQWILPSQCIPPSIPPEQPASGSRRVSR